MFLAKPAVGVVFHAQALEPVIRILLSPLPGFILSRRDLFEQFRQLKMRLAKPVAVVCNYMKKGAKIFIHEILQRKAY